MKLNGIYTALITPYNLDYSINEQALEKVINKIIEEGVHGIVLSGSTGENYSQTLDERIHLMKCWNRCSYKNRRFYKIRKRSKISWSRCDYDFFSSLRGSNQ